MSLIGRPVDRLLRHWRLAKLSFILLLVSLFALLIVADAEAATATAAGLALLGAVFTLDHADATARRARTAEYRARWDHPDLLDARIAAAEFLNAPDSEQDRRWEDWLTDMETKSRLQLMAVLNFWEAVSSAYNQDLLDREWFRTDLAWELIYAWERAEWFIRKYRVEEKNASGYCEWQVALEDVRDDVAQQVAVGEHRADLALSRGEDLLEVDQQEQLEA